MRTLSTCTTVIPQPARAVFELWADPTSWAQWDPEVTRVDFDGPVALAASGRLTPRRGPSTRFVITRLESDRLLTNESILPGARLEFEHLVGQAESGARVSVTVRVLGPLAALWARLLRGTMSDSARSSVDGLMRHLVIDPS